VAVFTPCKLLICINIAMLLGESISYLVLQCFLFVIFRGIFVLIFDLTI
jgi:hypothetical protein